MIRLKLWLAGTLAGLLALFSIWTAGRRDGVQKASVEAGKAYVETRENMDEVDNDFGDDPALARRFLHERGQSGRDL